MRALRKILLVWMILWLPAAGALAAVMPLKGIAQESNSPAASQSSGDDSMPLMPCHGKSGKGSVPGEGCSHCVLCHLAGALVMSHLPVVPGVKPTHVFTATPAVSHPSFVPDLLVPPPRALLA